MRIWLAPVAALLVAIPLRAGEKDLLRGSQRWARSAIPLRTGEKPIEIPYKLLDTKHVMVRIKINGKGPFNLIMDTGAPALFLATESAKKAGLVANKDGWAAIDKLELEGGLIVEKAKCVIEDPFQLKGMNSMGLAGVELHGMIGFNILAKYKIQYDFTSDKLLLTPLKYDLPPVERLGDGKSKGQPGGLELIGTLMKFIAPLMGMNGPPVREGRGFLGAELAEDDGVMVKSVLLGGPADKAGLKAGDKIEKIGKTKIDLLSDVMRLTGKLKGGDELPLSIIRGGSDIKATVTLGKGL
jgi:hypothetical protein